MKALTIAGTLLASIFFYACGPSNNDSIAQADSVNEAKTDTAQAQHMPAAAVATEDADFAVEAANGGMTEVELGRIAQEKAADSKVKDFGAMMVADHSKANEELSALATRKNITLPAAPGKEEQKTISELSAKSGKEFDKAYVDAMVKDHEKDIKFFEEAQKKVKDADIRQFIDKTLPVLRTHLDHINHLQKSK